jgi:acyl-CoA thioester hydrolase
VTGGRGPDPKPEDFRFSCEIAPRFRDLDAMGHVNNAVYATYFEVARTEYLRALGLGDSGGDGLGMFKFIMLDVYCRFVAPALLTDVLVAHLRTSSIGTKSFAFEYLITRRRDGGVVATGTSTQVYYDYEERRTLPVPPAFRERVERLEGRTLAR